MSTKLISIAKEFSPSPAGRYVSDGPYPGETFREKYLLPALQSNEDVTIDLDGTDGFGSSFLEEAFGGLIRRGFTEAQLRKRLHIKSERQFYEMRIWNYIKNARSEEGKAH